MNIGYDYWGWDKELSHEICQKLINLGKGKWNLAQTHGSEEKNKSLDNIRKSEVGWINEQWVHELVWKYMLATNEQAGWNYNIVAVEACQVTRYTKDGFYTWHKDGMGSHKDVSIELDNKYVRKISMSIILNSNYEGGDFEIAGLDDKNQIPRLVEGSVVVFPSFISHRVTPVTKGIRYSLVVWFVGPPFK